jgi:hypothetical protein
MLMLHLFLRYYPDFHIFIDLKGFDENLKTYFPMVRDKVFDLVIEGGVTDCYFNYDTATGSFQVKDARIRNAMEISNLDMVSCDVKSATLKNCNIYDSKIKKCILDECYLVRSTEVMDSKFNNSRAESTNELKDCYIDCNDKSVNCKIEGGVFASGVLGDFSEVSKETKRAKNWNVIRGERLVTDKRLKNLNFEYPNMKFGNMNY